MRYVVDENAYRTELERYHAVNYALTLQGIRPGYVTVTGGRLVMRGEFEDVPKRFLDRTDRREGYGDVDDRAGELGFVDGDELVAWMKRARRPRKADFLRPVPGTTGSRDRMARKRAKRDDGACIVCTKEPAREGRATCYWCSAAATIRMARRREAAKALESLDATG